MNLAKIYEALQSPQLITPSAHASLSRLFESHALLSAAEFKAEREGVDSCGGAIEIPQAFVEDGIGFIPIGGPIGQGFGKFEKGQGCVDVDDVEDELMAMAEDPECRKVLLVFDSPGGMVSGTPELAEKIAAFEKPIYAFTRGQCCSAAYWLACATDGIYATQTADIGSIGVYIPWADYSEALKAEGVSVEVFASGKFKGMGYPGTSLTKDQRALIMERVQQINSMFQAQVNKCRGEVDPETMQGQSFMAEESHSRNLIDAVVSDLNDCLSRI